MLANSHSKAGGTAVYVSLDLEFIERPDIKFDFPDCEANFVEIVCDTPGPNPIFGSLYRHPKKIFHYSPATWESFLRALLVEASS